MKKVTRTKTFSLTCPGTSSTANSAVPTGPAGARGSAGPVGPQGVQGPRGVQGLPGSGTSAVVLSKQLTCPDDNTAHRLSIVLDGSYTYEVSQDADLSVGDPDAFLLRCPDDDVCIELSIRLDGGEYMLGIEQSASSSTTFDAAVAFLCRDDLTIHYLMVRFDGSYTVAITQ